MQVVCTVVGFPKPWCGSVEREDKVRTFLGGLPGVISKAWSPWRSLDVCVKYFSELCHLRSNETKVCIHKVLSFICCGFLLEVLVPRNLWPLLHGSQRQSSARASLPGSSCWHALYRGLLGPGPNSPCYNKYTYLLLLLFLNALPGWRRENHNGDPPTTRAPILGSLSILEGLRAPPSPTRPMNTLFIWPESSDARQIVSVWGNQSRFFRECVIWTGQIYSG